jgi:hypothetical protein
LLLMKMATYCWQEKDFTLCMTKRRVCNQPCNSRGLVVGSKLHGLFVRIFCSGESSSDSGDWRRSKLSNRMQAQSRTKHGVEKDEGELCWHLLAARYLDTEHQLVHWSWAQQRQRSFPSGNSFRV